jgi:UDP-N-acetylglucosamine 4-epimerase
LSIARIHRLADELRLRPRHFVVTGAAGFIGSNLVEELLRLDQTVAGLDDFSHGKPANLQAIRDAVGEERWSRFRFVEGDIRDATTCRALCRGASAVLHQAALGSVPRSLEEPALYHAVNVTGTLNMLVAAREAEVPRFVYASSSAVYGDEDTLPKTEDRIGKPLSPYAATKRIDELYADVLSAASDLETIGLRYFNVFGPRQDPHGAYAAVIPCWIKTLLEGHGVIINGTGETSRDFCYIQNVVQANLLASEPDPSSANQIYNIACGERTTLLELHDALQERLVRRRPGIKPAPPRHRPFRAGDILHSLADIGKAKSLLGYEPEYSLARGLDDALDWYLRNVS